MNRFHFIPILITLFHFNLAFAQESDSCAVPNSTPIPLVPEGCFLQDGSNADDFIVSEWLEDPEIFDLRALLVVAPSSLGETSGEVVNGEFIIGITESGNFDFYNNGNPFSTGTYKFYPFATSQEELDELQAFIYPLLPLLNPHDLFGDNLQIETFIKIPSVILGDMQIDDFNYFFCDFLATLEGSFNFGIGEPIYKEVINISEVDCFTGIENEFVNEDIKVNYLKESQILTIELQSPIKTDTRINIYSSNGQLLESGKWNSDSNKQLVRVNKLEQGINFIQVIQNKKALTKRFYLR